MICKHKSHSSDYARRLYNRKSLKKSKGIVNSIEHDEEQVYNLVCIGMHKDYPRACNLFPLLWLITQSEFAFSKLPKVWLQLSFVANN